MADNHNEREAISNLQKYLRRLSQFDNDIRLVPIDGIYEEDTRLAVLEFQQKYGLPLTGVADRATWNMIFDKYSDLTEEKNPPDMLSLFPRNPSGYELQTGDAQFLVDAVQFILDELRIDYDTLGEVKRTGTYDTATENAVREFQRINSLNITGKVNKSTWDALATQYNKSLKDYRQ